MSDSQPGMRRLDDVAAAVKSTNAGASLITFDIVFHDLPTFRRVAASGALSAEVIAERYSVDVKDVQVFAYDPAFTIKITIPRRVKAGRIEERDFDGVQQFPLLLDLLVPG